MLLVLSSVIMPGLLSASSTWVIALVHVVYVAWKACEQDGITLQQMLEIGILDHIDTLERISVKASRHPDTVPWG